jgi:Mrp family chromosome partitioning ATPase
MSKNFAVVSTAGAGPFARSWPEDSSTPAPAPAGAVSPKGEYTELIQQLFHKPAAVAIIGSNSGDPAEAISQIASALSAELAASGKRVVVVPVHNLLRMNPIKFPEETAFEPGAVPRVWHWPTAITPKVELFKSLEPSGPGNWLDALRRYFDCIVFDCPSLEVAPGVTEVAAMADSAVLAVDAGVTSKQQIQQNQQALQFRGARVAGCILIKGR